MNHKDTLLIRMRLKGAILFRKRSLLETISKLPLQEFSVQRVSPAFCTTVGHGFLPSSIQDVKEIPKSQAPLQNWAALNIFWVLSLADSDMTWNQTTNNNTKNVKCNTETCQYFFIQSRQQQIQSEIMPTKVVLWKPIHLMSQPPNKLYMYTYTSVHTAHRSRRHGWWDCRMAWHITESVHTRHSVLLKRGLNLIRSDRTGTREWSRHPKVVMVSFLRTRNATTTLNQN